MLVTQPRIANVATDLPCILKFSRRYGSPIRNRPPRGRSRTGTKEIRRQLLMAWQFSLPEAATYGVQLMVGWISKEGHRILQKTGQEERTAGDLLKQALLRGQRLLALLYGRLKHLVATNI